MSAAERYRYEDWRGSAAEGPLRPAPSRRRYLPGDRVGAWTVVEYAGLFNGDAGTPCYLCRCGCGTEQLVATSNLIGGNTTRCAACAYADPDRTQRRTTPYVCRWCGRDYTSRTRAAQIAAQERGGARPTVLAAECSACYRRAQPSRNGRDPCGYPRRRGGVTATPRPATDHRCELCSPHPPEAS